MKTNRFILSVRLKPLQSRGVGHGELGGGQGKGGPGKGVREFGAERVGGTYMLASLRCGSQGPRGHAPQPSPGSAAPSSPDEAPQPGRARWPDPPSRSFWRVHRGFPGSSGVAQGGRSAPRSSSANRRGQGAGGAAGSSLRRSWRKVRARTWKRLGPPGSRCWGPRGLPGWLGGRVGGGVRWRAAARGHPLGGSVCPPTPPRRLGLFPGPVHPARASGAECAGPGAQVRLPPRRLAGPRAALGRPQPR